MQFMPNSTQILEDLAAAAEAYARQEHGVAIGTDNVAAADLRFELGPVAGLFLVKEKVRHVESPIIPLLPAPNFDFDQSLRLSGGLAGIRTSIRLLVAEGLAVTLGAEARLLFGDLRGAAYWLDAGAELRF
jgi:hypothetical protein